MNFKNVPKKYRPIPFWSWNERLDAEETARQVKMMDEAGMGGFFMHARGGLQTEYMGDEWFDNVTSATETALGCSLRPWAYDENGWPSGFGAGLVNGMGVEYQQKYLRVEDKYEHKDTSICKCGNHYFYYDVNPFYVDTLDKKVINEFIDKIYQPYYDKYKNKIEGFFTDEPQISRNGIPWSFVFEKEYKERYNENILEKLEELFFETGDYKITRFKFWKMVTDLFSSSFMKQIYDWCSERNMKLTGHLVLEESLNEQITTNGACMPHYEYFHIPGMDWLGRYIRDCLTARQVASVAAQLDKEAVLSETFGLCGHNVSFDELKGVFEWQMVRGINLLCQHLEGYSIRGLRKRDYPPAMYYQQPWWNDYSKFIDAMSRIGMILNEGREDVSVLVIHPMSSAWTMYNDSDIETINELNNSFLELIKTLEKKHIEFHLGDETIMERHAKIENGELIIGTQRYSKIILPPHEILFDSTQDLLNEFKAQGGEITTVDAIESNCVINNESITYTSRTFEDCRIHYFVNSTPYEQSAVLEVEGKRINIYTGELEDQTKEYVFEPWGSLLIVEDGSKFVKQSDKEINYTYADGKFAVCGKVKNVLVLDKCDYYFDGELQEKNGYVLNISQRANALEKMVHIKQDYYVQMNYIPESLHLVCETPEKFNIFVNGQRVCQDICGTFVDSSFKCIEIANHIKKGNNTITFECDFVQSKLFYENLKKAYVFESEKNKLSYDMEVEAVYLVGDFSVTTAGVWKPLDKDAQRYYGDFVIDAPVKEVELKDIQKQGFPFFCGSLTVEKETKINKNTILKMNPKGVNVIKCEVDGQEEIILTGKKEINLGRLAGAGKHTIRLTLTNNLRNLLGPHHLKEGECYYVSPGRFFKENCLWNKNAEDQWDDNYCFIDFGI